MEAGPRGYGEIFPLRSPGPETHCAAQSMQECSQWGGSFQENAPATASGRYP